MYELELTLFHSVKIYCNYILRDMEETIRSIISLLFSKIFFGARRYPSQGGQNCNSQTLLQLDVAM